MFLGLLVMITALSISAVAIYYSVAGLVAIFAAAAVPIMIMGGALEIGKLVTAVWLHRYWHEARWWLKTYLSVAVIVLMFITSMGIFGFLSKAHIEQTATAQEGLAQLERIDTELARQQAVIDRAEQKIVEAESSVGKGNETIQAQIDLEQTRIESAYDRIQPAIDEQNRIIVQQTALFEQELRKIDEELALLQSYINGGDIRRAQQMVGARADGEFGPATAAAFQSFQDAKAQERSQWLERIQQAQQNDTVLTAREEIRRLRNSADEQVAQSNALIQSLRESLTIGSDQAVESTVLEQQQKIIEANNTIDTLTEQKYTLQAEYRKLEAEVGPVKYLAEFIYGEQADTVLLEEAVRWVIIIIIFVFDPLAVLLLIASQATFEMRRNAIQKTKEDQQILKQKQWREYEQARAQAIVNNPGWQQEEKNNGNTDRSNDVGSFGEQQSETQGDIERTDTGSGDTQTETIDTAMHRLSRGGDKGRDNTGGMDEVELEEIKKKEQQRLIEYEAKENNTEIQNSKTSWKKDHPEETLKYYKNLYIKGMIDSLPWEDYKSNDNYNVEDGYKQNSEQDEKTLFNKIQRRNSDEN